MTKYAQNGGLTRFDTGSTHEQNPLSGIPIGNNNNVEENETKQNNFVYSNRIFLDSNIVSQYNLPKSLTGKSVADATKMIDDKFKDRNDKISQSTKNSMLSKIAEAQEAMKPQEPEIEQGYSEEMMDNGQMAWGGFKDSVIGQGFGEDTTAGQKSAALGAGLGVATGALDLGMTAFGKPEQNTDGLAASSEVNSGAMIGGSAIKGAATGAAFGPLGAGIGALVGAGAGLLGAGKAKKAAMENSNNFALNMNRKFSDQYALGGELDPTKINKTQLLNTAIIPNTTPTVQSDRFRYAVGEQGGVQHGTSGEQGYYLYYGKKPGDAGFNPAVNREFVNQGGYDTYMKSPQGQQYRRNLQTQPKQMEDSGKMNQMFDGGDYYENLKLTSRNTAPIESINELNPIGTTVPYTIDTQPIVDISNANRQMTSGPSNLDMLKYNAKKVGTAVNDNLGNLARYAPIAANALQLAQLKKPQGERLDRLSNRYKPEYVDEAQLQNITNQTMNNTVNALGQSGASQGQLRSSLIGSQLQRTKALSDAYNNAASQNRTTNDRAQQFNSGIDRVNLQQSNTEKDINARDKGNYDTQKSRLIGQLGNDIGNVGKEEIYKKIAKTTTGYSWLGEYQKMNPNATPEETKAAAEKAGVLVKDAKIIKKQALGGYLIKNKK